MCRQFTSVSTLLLITVMVSCTYAQLPSGWAAANIGSPAATGSVQYDKIAEAWTIQGDGTGIRGNTDQCYYVYRTLSGDGELAARVASLTPPVSDWSMAGVMIRVVLQEYSPYIFMGVSANTDAQDHGLVVAGRLAVAGPVDLEGTGSITAPYWVKVKRAGDTFSAHASPDGKVWTEVNSTVAPGIGRDIYIGYVVASEVAGTLVTAVFDKGPVKATDPTPADKAVHVDVPLLSWTAGIVAAAHDVYVGTNPTLGQSDYLARLPVSQTAWPLPFLLAPETTYYWRVDELGSDGTTIYEGDIWRFTSAPARAYAPDPWDRFKGVTLGAGLAWIPGINAESHDVYFGTDAVAVRAGSAGTFKGNQISATFDPGTLAENTTYYWRVDERTGDGEVHPGDVWSFKTIGPGLGVRAEYFRGTDEPTGMPILTRVEDSIDHNWGSGEVAGGLNDAVSARWTANLEVPFTGTYELITTTDDGVRLWLDDRRLVNNWTNHGTADDIARVDLTAGQVCFLQMEWYESGGSALARLSWQGPSIERQIIPRGVLQLPLWAATPYPANAAVNSPQTLTLRWRAGEDATHHDIYFGDDPRAVADADRTTAGINRARQAGGEATYDVGPLEWGKTYYWRIDEVNTAGANGLWKGNVWSFTTAGFIVVDDFESYTNDVGNRVFQTWLDGYGFTEPQLVEGNKTRAVVGHDIWSESSPQYRSTIVETKIVRPGSTQSMPMAYDNQVSPYYAETERTWAMPQNWTANEMNTLVLCVRGAASNTPAPLYVGLQDSGQRLHIIQHDNPAILTELQWSEWKIPLATFSNAGVNLATVKKMYIGAGSRGASTPGGTGTVYVDDIRVIRSE